MDHVLHVEDDESKRKEKGYRKADEGGRTISNAIR